MSSIMTEQPGQVVDPNTGLPVTAGPSVVPSQQRVNRNPMLPQHPLGAYTDAQYEAQVAELRAQTARQYNDVLRQLGYVDDQGNFVMGSAETQAAQKRSDAQYQENLERQRVTHEMQQAGTLFSGYRGTQEGQRTMPYEQTQAQIGIDLPNQLSQLYEQAGNVVSDFVTQHNKLLADAAGRATQGQIAAPGGGATTTPPPDPTIPPGQVAVPGGTVGPVQTFPDPPPGTVAAIPGDAFGGITSQSTEGSSAFNHNTITGALTGRPAPARTLANAAVPAPAPAPTPAPAYDPGQIAQAAKAKRQQHFQGV